MAGEWLFYLSTGQCQSLLTTGAHHYFEMEKKNIDKPFIYKRSFILQHRKNSVLTFPLSHKPELCVAVVCSYWLVPWR